MPFDCTAGSSADTSSNVWLDWNTSDATANVWYKWTCTTSANSTNAITSNIWYVWTDEAWEEYANTGQVIPQNADTWEKLCAEQAAAKEKAATILKQNLTDEQRAQLAREKFFVVNGSKGKKYRVEHGRSRNVVELDDNGRAIARLCAHPGVQCPDEDTMLAQKLMLETDEEAFHRIANRSAA